MAGWRRPRISFNKVVLPPPSGPTPVIEINDLSFRFDSGALVLENVTLDIREGELFFLLGPSGCGKTTCLRVIAGFVEQDSGSVSIGGEVVEDGEPLTAFCAPYCDESIGCPAMDETQGACLLTAGDNLPADRCALVCEGTGADAAGGCPVGMTCSEHGDVWICIWTR